MNKFAILLECDPSQTLGGSCLRDIENMAGGLIKICNFDDKNIYILTTNSFKSKYTFNCFNSKELFNIIDRINKLNPTFIVVLLSGHGFSIKDISSDEMDGYDEVINIGYQLNDDQIYEGLVKKISCNGILLADTCHSGTMFDLPFIYNGTNWIKYTKRNDKFNNKIISLSACADNQLSMCDIGEITGFGGSLTTALLNLDGVLKHLIDMSDLKKVYGMIKSRLLMLNQTLMMSSTQLYK